MAKSWRGSPGRAGTIVHLYTQAGHDVDILGTRPLAELVATGKANQVENQPLPPKKK